MIEQLLAANEGKTLEFKETARSLDGIVKTVIAFANSAGGVIVIGVKDKTKELVGVPQILFEEERLTSAITDSIFPFLTPDIEICSLRSKELLILRISHGMGPYYLKSEGPELGVYVRFGSTNRRVDAEMLDALRLLAKKISYDELPHPKGKLNEDALIDIFHWVGKKPTAHVLENLGVETSSSGKKYLSNGGVLLFGSNRIQLFPDSLIRCARFAGVNREKILDQMDIDAPLPQAADLIISFIERNIAKEGRIGRLQRQDILQYPPITIREATMNALLHTDYAMTGCHIQIAIFDDRIEFTNPGGLPFGQTIEKALEGSSRIRNRVIARVFRELRLIEQWGSGLRRIVEACQTHEIKPPLIEELNNQFRITLYSKQKKAAITPLWTKKIIDYLKKENSINAKTAMKLWKVSSRTARNRLKQLQEQKLIARIGTSENDPNAAYVSIKSAVHL